MEPVQTGSANDFCMLLHWGGVDPNDAVGARCDRTGRTIRWYNIYGSGIGALWTGSCPATQPTVAGTYYIQYPVVGSTDAAGNVGCHDFDTSQHDRCRARDVLGEGDLG